MSDARHQAASSLLAKLVSPMNKIQVTLACEQYDRTDALREGRIQPEGIDLVYLPALPTGDILADAPSP